MPGPKPRSINLTDVERKGLELLVRRHSTGQQKVIRARIILQAANGKNNQEIVRDLNVSVDVVRLWRQRWLDLQPISHVKPRFKKRNLYHPPPFETHFAFMR
jgi:hypothetical protein